MTPDGRIRRTSGGVTLGALVRPLNPVLSLSRSRARILMHNVPMKMPKSYSTPRYALRKIILWDWKI